MHKRLTGLAAAAALAFLASAGQACDFHTNVSASVPSEQTVAMSTAGDATTACPAGQANCAPANK